MFELAFNPVGETRVNTEISTFADGYEQLLPSIRSMNVRRFVLGNTTPQAGGTRGGGKVLAGKWIESSVANTRIDQIEIVTDIALWIDRTFYFLYGRTSC